MSALAMAVSLSCGATAAGADGVSGIISSQELLVGSDLTYPPYNFLQADRPAGFDPEFMHILADGMGLKARFIDTRFVNLVPGLNARRFDVIASALYVTPERAKLIEYVPYLKTGASLIVRRGERDPQSPADLCGLRLASIQGASWLAKLPEVSRTACASAGKPPIDVREFPTSPEAAQAVLARGADVQIEDAAVAGTLVRQLGSRLEISSRTLLYPIVIGIGVVKGNGGLADALRRSLERARADGRYARLLFDYGLQEPTPQDVADALAAK